MKKFLGLFLVILSVFFCRVQSMEWSERDMPEYVIEVPEIKLKEERLRNVTLNNVLYLLKNMKSMKIGDDKIITDSLRLIKDQISEIDRQDNKLLHFQRAVRALKIIAERVEQESNSLTLSNYDETLSLCQTVYDKQRFYKGREQLDTVIIQTIHVINVELDKVNRSLPKTQRQEISKIRAFLQKSKKFIEAGIKSVQSVWHVSEADEHAIDLQLSFEEEDLDRQILELKWFGVADRPGDKAIVVCSQAARAGFDSMWINPEVQRELLNLCKNGQGLIQTTIDLLDLFCIKNIQGQFGRLELVVTNKNHGLLIDIINALVQKEITKKQQKTIITLFEYFSSEPVLLIVEREKETGVYRQLLTLNIQLFRLNTSRLIFASMRVFNRLSGYVRQLEVGASQGLFVALKKDLTLFGLDLCLFPQLALSDLIPLVSNLLSSSLKKVVMSDDYNKQLFKLYFKIYRDKNDALEKKQLDERLVLGKKLETLEQIGEVIKERAPVSELVSIFARKLQVQGAFDFKMSNDMLVLCSWGLKEGLASQDVQPFVEIFSEEKNFSHIKTVLAKQALLTLCEALINSGVLLPEVIRVVKIFHIKPVEELQKQLLNLCMLIMSVANSSQAKVQEDVEAVLDIFLNIGSSKLMTDTVTQKNVLNFCEQLLNTDVNKFNGYVIRALGRFAAPGVMTTKTDGEVQIRVLSLCLSLWDQLGDKKIENAIRVFEKIIGVFGELGLLTVKLDADIQQHLLRLSKNLVIAGKGKDQAALILKLFSTKERLEGVITEMDKQALLYLTVTLFENKKFTQHIFDFFKKIAEEKDLVSNMARWYMATLFTKACLKWIRDKKWLQVGQALDLLKLVDINDIMKDKQPDVYDAFYVQLMHLYIRVLKQVTYDWRQMPIFKWVFGESLEVREQRADVLEKIKEQVAIFAKILETGLKEKKYFQTKNAQAVILDWCQMLLKVKTLDSQLITPIVHELASGDVTDEFVKRAISLIGVLDEPKPVEEAAK